MTPFDRAIEPIAASDDELRAALAEAEPAPLLPALALATGDLSILRDDLRPDPLLFALPQGGFTDEQVATIREVAFGVLRRFRDGGSSAAPIPRSDDLRRILEFAVGGVDMHEYLPLLEEELALRGDDPRAPRWRLGDVAPGRELRVVVVGAGMSGLLAAHRLQQAGIAFVIIEKDDDVGGTWHENRYPGCRVDNPNHNYSYSFAQRHDWPLHFSTQDVLHEYFRDCADAFDLRRHVRFRTEVVSMTWSERDATWSVTVRGPDGAEEVVTADAVVSAVGQLNRPHLPEIPGRDDFAGPSWHSARWRHDVDLRGRRVAVIGTGASAMQFVPEIADVVGELHVLQRTPAWMGPTPEYHERVPEGLRWLYRHVPGYSELHRFCIFWRMGDGALMGVTVDPTWDGDGGSVGPMNEFLRQFLLAYMGEQFADRPDLLAQVTPAYPPGAKRVIRDNGAWAAALKAPHVRLVTTGIRAIDEKGVELVDGEHLDVDVIVYGTGFTASDFLVPMRVVGRDGREIHDVWAGDARAHLGVTVPGFPNLFLLYGPNTNIVINGSIIYFSECGVRHIMNLLELVLRGGHRSVEVRADVHDEFNAAVDAANRAMAWGASDVNSWYKSASGRVSQNWPFTLVEYWRRTLEADPAEFELR